MMDRCPACNARWTGKPDCHRCGTDLARLAAMGSEAEKHRQQAAAAFRAGDHDAMYRHAKRSCDFRRTPPGAASLATAALLTGRFDEALSEWARLTGMRGDRGSSHE